MQSRPSQSRSEQTGGQFNRAPSNAKHPKHVVTGHSTATIQTKVSMQKLPMTKIFTQECHVPAAAMPLMLRADSKSPVCR